MSNVQQILNDKLADQKALEFDALENVRPLSINDETLQTIVASQSDVSDIKGKKNIHRNLFMIFFIP